MEWSREKRYRQIKDVSKESYDALVNQVATSKYRQKYHVQPKSGLLNDPNGFSYFNGQYHLFYQWFPLGPVHGLKNWYHVSSKDLVHWEDHGIGLAPEKYYETHGVFSGTGFVKDDQLYLFYTGNTRVGDWVRIPYQCLAIMDKDGQIKKAEKPLIKDSPEGFTDNYRDPKVLEYNGRYYCLIGAEKSSHHGCIAYYSSDDLYNWTYEGVLPVAYNGGYMWECPDYFTLEDKGIMLVSVQGQKKEGDRYNNIFPAGYLVGNTIDFTNPSFDGNTLYELDHGFDFYAPQTTVDKDGRRILVGWLGLPGVDCVTDEDGWAHCITLPRELSLKDGHLYQKPVDELELLCTNERTHSFILNGSQTFDDVKGHTYRLKVLFESLEADTGVKLRCGQHEETLFYYDSQLKKLVFDRTHSGVSFNEEYGSKRYVAYNHNFLKLDIFVDVSSVEVFVNDGEYVFTSRIFTKPDSEGITFFSDEETKTHICMYDI